MPLAVWLLTYQTIDTHVRFSVSTTSITSDSLNDLVKKVQLYFVIHLSIELNIVLCQSPIFTITISPTDVCFPESRAESLC